VAEYRRQRLAPRVQIAGQPAVRVRSNLPARLVDLSLTGARIAHLDLLRPGSPITVELPAPIGSLALSVRVAWSSVVGSEPSPEGERRLRYHSGLAFVGLTAEQQATLANILEQRAHGR
jgi:hypothetical protein